MKRKVLSIVLLFIIVKTYSQTVEKIGINYDIKYIEYQTKINLLIQCHLY